jgi:hypothetical protein
MAAIPGRVKRGTRNPGEFYPHRRVSLYFGYNEECGVRCVYHGWKFDVEGKADLTRGAAHSAMRCGLASAATSPLTPPVKLPNWQCIMPAIPGGDEGNPCIDHTRRAQQQTAFAAFALALPVRPRNLPVLFGEFHEAQALPISCHRLPKKFPCRQGKSRKRAWPARGPAMACEGSPPRDGAPFICGGSDRIVHLELDRMGGMLEIVHLLPFQLDI